ncbi:1-acyl-sn-glycerol-3-phosphate acyltransferase [Rhizobium ruizarguesonis]|jgi:1-acyl-sn-glycerol-3-phosphate acyltransferase|uniref:1-acyl-sn-glycerol-3-phosphate acyltransferase n=1 Tax=Rhizobium ruizarguesonis TaxID=2081791 RepID=A0ABY1WZ53_9HYPH|nr:MULTISPECIES: lysophospholipid acyltransferase family protein [Rhizobium]MBW8789996.1 1-acyl-sn-glycerol-3-phosphate acyltransferase [Rhizobium leguminosarum]MBY5369987.1 1-acyl-sn-glycerol-3-phosphate acyltransferase [Rhizobium leguminosarum]MBY5452995.1 1-acyl-sn-glycerol-3-phosphate acyltransferase [Rhizobium leguminosarum]NEI21250.1 1-acyl-sn-glycerol-3-phosphate acyltransferase [Rhizobium ruizarguesonis]NEJ87693.1 1-acyl-sn-glycerol-3-phosphate acyltransferase [Rhizobium ruizarguesonis
MIAIIRRFLVLLVRILVGARSEWRGCAPDPSRRIYFANHNSHIDTVAVMAALPWPVRRMTHPVAARDYWGTSAFRRFIAEKGLRAVLIDRKPLPDTDPLAPIERLLEEGRSVLIFPEGTRSTTDEIAPFRSGIFRLACRFPDVDLVPIHLDNLQRILPKGSMLIVPITCTARFGKPLRVEPGEEKAEFLARARAAVIELADGGHTA